MARRPLKTPAPTQKKPARAASSSGKGWIAALILIALGGGGYYGYDQYQKSEQERLAREAARRARIEAEKRKAEEERLAAEKAERERQAAEEAERRRLEAKEKAEEEERRRKEAEAEAERLRKQRESQKSDDTPAPKPKDTDKPEPAPEPVKKESTIYDQELLLHGADANSISARKQFDTLIDHLLEKGDFADFERAMSEKIKVSIPNYAGNGKLNYAQYKNNRNLMQAVDLCLLIRMAGANELSKLVAKEGDDNDNGGADFFRWAIRDKSRPLHLFMQSFASQEGRPENAAHSINLFYTIWTEIPARDRVKYLNLAVAGSLMNPEVCNSRGGIRDASATILTVPEVCAYLREMDGKRKLVTDIKKLSVSQLMHVVNVRLPQSEIDWAAENVNYTQAKWGEAYGSIRYLMERATGNKDPYKLYTFEEIKREGGVCRDQGYFSCNTGKCRGVPAVYIVGDGDRGPHAWMVNLTDATTWVQTNSYGYNSGRFTNPCSGRSQHESVLLSRSAKNTDAKLVPASDAMVLANYLVRIDCIKEAHGTARYVTEAFPEETAAWANYIKVLGHSEKHLPPASVWRKIDTDLIRLSRKNSELLDLAGEVEDKYLLAGKNAASKQAAMNRSMSQLNRRGGDDRADLVLSAVDRQASVMAEAGNYRGLANLYSKQLKKYTKRGDIFGQLLRQYMGHLGEEATQRDWNTLARSTEKLFEKHMMSNGSDFFKLKKEVEIQNMIAEAWDKAGNSRKAEKLREFAQERLERGQQQHGGSED